MDPAAYDAWYASQRGRWIGDVETALLLRLLECRGGDAILDVGCGTGYFSRRLAQAGFRVTGIDNDPGALGFAASKDAGIRYLQADARRLPFADRSFDCAVAVTSLCFIEPASFGWKSATQPRTAGRAGTRRAPRVPGRGNCGRPPQ